MLDDTVRDELLENIDRLLRSAQSSPAPTPPRVRKHETARQHSPERELALTSVLAALRKASYVRMSEADCQLNQVARDYILRLIQEERSMAHRSMAGAQ